jgi:hypothetical protein
MNFVSHYHRVPPIRWEWAFADYLGKQTFKPQDTCIDPYTTNYLINDISKGKKITKLFESAKYLSILFSYSP